MKKINVININTKYSIMHDEYGIVPEWVELVSGGFFKFLEGRFGQSKVVDCEPY